MSQHHDAVLHEIQEMIQKSVFHAHRIADPIDCDVDSKYFGLGLIICQGFLQREMNKIIDVPPANKLPKRMKPITQRPCIREIDYWHYKFDPKSEWYGWQELANCFRLADCYAKDKGNLNGHGPRVKAFARQMKKEEIRDRKKKPVTPYFAVEDGENLKLEKDAVQRFALLSGELIKMVEKQLRKRKKRK